MRWFSTALAAMTFVLSWVRPRDASILWQPEQQANPHPATYSLRGNLRFRMAKVFDPVTRRP